MSEVEKDRIIKKVMKELEKKKEVVIKRDKCVSEDKAVEDKEEYIEEEIIDDEEYINSENDPEKVLIVPEDDCVISDNEEIVEFDEVFETVKTMITNLTNHDYIMEEKVLDALRRGKLK